MKIVFLGLHARMTGGVESVNRTLARELIRRGHEVFFGFLRLLGDEDEPEGVKVFCAREEPWHFTLGGEIRSALSRRRFLSAAGLYLSRKSEEKKRKADEERLRAWLIETDPDLVVVSQYLLLPCVPEKMLEKTFFHLHDSFEHAKTEKAVADAMQSCKGKVRLILLSEASRRAAEADGFKGCVSLYNPVLLSGESEGKNVVVLARFAAQKRIPHLISLVRRALDETASPAKLLLYGDGEEEEAVKEAAAGDERIVLPGRTKDAAKALKDASFTVVASAYEGFSISVLEAAAMGVPAVSYRFEAFPEEILDGVTGYLVPEGDDEAFVKAVCRYLSDPALARRHGANARAWAKNFAPGAVVDQWERKVFSLLDK